MDAAGLANDARVRALTAFDEFNPAHERAALFPFVYQRMIWHLMAVTKDESRVVRVPHKHWAVKRPRSELSISEGQPGRKVRNLAAVTASPLDEMILSEEVTALRAALDTLPPRTAEIMRRRSHDETLQEIGDSMGLSRERVRQLEVQALAQLRQALESAPATRPPPGGGTLSTTSRARAKRSAPSCAPESSPTRTPTLAGGT